MSLYDYVVDKRNLESIERADRLFRSFSLLEQQAIQNALMAHPITGFVCSAEVESSMYPAIRSSYVSLSKNLVNSKIRTSERSADRTDHPNMIWNLPGRRPGRYCGVFRSSYSSDVPIKMCIEYPEHFMKAVSGHCYSLSCKNCMNYAAMQYGVRIEDRVCTPPDIRSRISGKPEYAKHWAISPPQKWLKGVMQRSDHFSELVDDLCCLLPEYGFSGGCIVFHPWRLSKDGKVWKLSPHFHVVGYGRFRNMDFRSDLTALDEKMKIWNDDGKEESWVFNQIHPNDPLRSVRHTIAYIMTHAGIGSFDFDADFCDAADKISIPIESGTGTLQRAKTITQGMIEGDGWRQCKYYAEHLDEIDWLEWTKKVTTSTLPSYRVFGDVTKIGTVAEVSDRVPRLCPECGQTIGRFEGLSCTQYQPVMYVHRSPIRAFKHDIPRIRKVMEELRDQNINEGGTDLDLVKDVAICSTPESKGLQEERCSTTSEERIAALDHKLVYVPSEKYKRGYDPVIMTRSEFRIWKDTGVVPETAVRG